MESGVWAAVRCVAGVKVAAVGEVGQSLMFMTASAAISVVV
jgi:hypothetical protein